MNKRNMAWLAAIVVVAVVGSIAFEILWGVIGGVVVLIASEVVERTRRVRRRKQGIDAPSARQAIAARRKKR
jgi:uncharacterized membrane-anchored protein